MKSMMRGVVRGLEKLDIKYAERIESEISQDVTGDVFKLTKTAVGHGLPEAPTAIAYDAVQGLFAVGTERGSIRIYGQDNVEILIKLDVPNSVRRLFFITNCGYMVVADEKDRLILVDFREKETKVVRTFSAPESFTCTMLPPCSKWLYVGTCKGNVQVVNVETFVLCGTIVSWKDVMPANNMKFPGAVIAIEEQPTDETKMLIAHNFGNLCLWDIKARRAIRQYGNQTNGIPVNSVAWHPGGKQFALAQADGIVSVWNVRGTREPAMVKNPISQRGDREPITRVCWMSGTDPEHEVMAYSGGAMKSDKLDYLNVHIGNGNKITVINGPVLDMLITSRNPWPAGPHIPQCLVVLLPDEIAFFDVSTPSLPRFQPSYGLDLCSSSVSAVALLTRLPLGTGAAIALTGKEVTRSLGFSMKEWPINGGTPGERGRLLGEDLLITGHLDGTIKIWDATNISLHEVYVIHLGNMFKMAGIAPPAECGVTELSVCPNTRAIAAGCDSGDVMVFTFDTKSGKIDMKLVKIMRRNARDQQQMRAAASPAPGRNTVSREGSGQNGTKEERFGNRLTIPGEGGGGAAAATKKDKK
eukprot:Opistho-2@85105